MAFVQEAVKRLFSPLLPEEWKRYVNAELLHVPDVEASLRLMKCLHCLTRGPYDGALWRPDGIFVRISWPLLASKRWS
jgi:hypothetical protein